MGCGGSAPGRDDMPAPRPRPQIAVSGPTGGPQMVPTPYRDERGRPITHMDFDLDRETLIRALNHMGQYLDQQGVTARVVTVGGAVNTIYLQSRSSTHDVDFFMEDPQAPVHQFIHEAARSAARSSAATRGVTLGANWFNNATQLLIGAQIQAQLTAEAVQQNTIVHQYRGQRGGIIIYAAPWAYAFCGKLNRLCEQNARPYDLDDAVVYLHEYLGVTHKSSVSKNDIFHWCQQYRKNATETVLDRVNNQFYQRYGHQVIHR